MFTQPVSMKCTQEQYEADLKQPLLEMGYKEVFIENFINYPCLVNNYSGNLGNLDVTWEHHKLNYNRYYIDHYNPDLFLALAAMTDEKYGIKGEWWKCNQSYSAVFTINKLYQTSNKIDCLFAFIDDNNISNDLYLDSLSYFSKATKKELITYFTTKQETKMETTKTYLATISQMMEIEAIACNTWKPKIRKMIKDYLDEATGVIVLQESIVKTMFEAATSEQKLILQSVFPLYGKQEDKNAFIKEFRKCDIESTSKQLFNSSAVLQILARAAPSDKPELVGRAFYVDSDYKVEIGKASPGTYISIYKK